MLELSNLCHCVQHPWKHTSRYYWSSRNKWKPLSKLKHVFRKCSGVSQKQWVLQLSNLCHCVKHPWKLTNRDFWSSGHESKPLSKQNVFWENAVGYLRNGKSLGVHILRDIAEIGWASQNWMNIFSFISSETPEMGTETFKTVIIVFSTPETY